MWQILIFIPRLATCTLCVPIFNFASIMSFRKLQGHGQLTVIAYGQGRVSSFGKQLLFWSGVCSN